MKTTQVTIDGEVTELPEVSTAEIDFCMCIVAGKTYHQAYAESHTHLDPISITKEQLRAKAAALLRRPEIKEWMSVLRIAAMREAMMTHNDYNSYLLELIEDARKAGAFTAVGSMAGTLGKSMGYLTERLHITDDRVNLADQIKKLERIDSDLAGVFKERFRINDCRDKAEEMLPIDVQVEKGVGAAAEFVDIDLVGNPEDEIEHVEAAELVDWEWTQETGWVEVGADEGEVEEVTDWESIESTEELTAGGSDEGSNRSEQEQD